MVLEKKKKKKKKGGQGIVSPFYGVLCPPFMGYCVPLLLCPPFIKNVKMGKKNGKIWGHNTLSPFLF